MNKIYLLILVNLILLNNSNAQNVTLIKEHALQINASYVGEVITNHAGGIRKGTSYQGMGNFMLEYDTEKGKLWKGGKFYLNAAHTHGGNPSSLFIGDFQVASNIEAGDLTYLHEMWISQTIGKAQITIGLQDLNVEFASSNHGSLFLNSSFGVHSTIADNIIAPIFPLTAFGAQLKYHINSRIALKLIAFDGFPDDFSENNPHNLRWRFKKEDGLLNIAELTWQPRIKGSLDGTYSFGSYTHHHFAEGDTKYTDTWEITNYGFYLVADQTLATHDNGSVVNAFLQASVSPSQKNENCNYFGFGLNYTNLFAKNDKDIIGIAVAHAGFANRSSETTFELTYQYQLNDQLSIQPDFQYIINPSGTDMDLENAFVTALRFNIAL